MSAPCIVAEYAANGLKEQVPISTFTQKKVPTGHHARWQHPGSNNSNWEHACIAILQLTVCMVQPSQMSP